MIESPQGETLSVTAADVTEGRKIAQVFLAGSAGRRDPALHRAQGRCLVELYRLRSPSRGPSPLPCRTWGSAAWTEFLPSWSFRHHLTPAGRIPCRGELQWTGRPEQPFPCPGQTVRIHRPGTDSHKLLRGCPQRLSRFPRGHLYRRLLQRSGAAPVDLSQPEKGVPD